MTFLLSEDDALRNKLLGITVTDQKAEGDNRPREVGVWFGQPDQELRAQNYPYITLNLIDVERDPSREMRGTTDASYLKPEDFDETKGFLTDIPIPVNLDYQITTFARHPRHDRAVLSQLLVNKLPIRFGVLEIDDNTVRRLDVLSVAKRDATEQAKRLFMNVITVRVSSEISPGTYNTLSKVTQVNIDPLDTIDAGGRPGDPYFESIGPDTITA
jgi:hypothetical protein